MVDWMEGGSDELVHFFVFDKFFFLSFFPLSSFLLYIEIKVLKCILLPGLLSRCNPSLYILNSMTSFQVQIENETVFYLCAVWQGDTGHMSL